MSKFLNASEVPSTYFMFLTLSLKLSALKFNWMFNTPPSHQTSWKEINLNIRQFYSLDTLNESVEMFAITVYFVQCCNNMLFQNPGITKSWIQNMVIHRLCLQWSHSFSYVKSTSWPCTSCLLSSQASAGKAVARDFSGWQYMYGAINKNKFLKLSILGNISILGRGSSCSKWWWPFLQTYLAAACPVDWAARMGGLPIYSFYRFYHVLMAFCASVQ